MVSEPWFFFSADIAMLCRCKVSNTPKTYKAINGLTGYNQLSKSYAWMSHELLRYVQVERMLHVYCNSWYPARLLYGTKVIFRTICNETRRSLVTAITHLGMSKRISVGRSFFHEDRVSGRGTDTELTEGDALWSQGKSGGSLHSHYIKPSAGSKSATYSS
jgi:hypothetical protein